MLSTLLNPLPYHILAYGTFLGSQLYQSFVNTKICYRSLSPQSFNNLNKRLFPVYFRCQLGLAILTFVTRPSKAWLQLPAANDVGNLLLALATIMAGLNWYVYGPRTSEAMVEKARVIQEAQDEKDGNHVGLDSNKSTEEKKTLVTKVKKIFSRNHAMSIHINLIAVIATVGYGFVLGGRLQLQ
ncbi:hypothetical protein TMatcc_009012 [Talaromyces marneffei ATCC 18224]|uniref:TMEM205-like domain-containing protein n=2 Tax=Talaromyces marneffei TaxID=37727 RepID=B6QNS9_TALMQ|nr:uncharacterized protein EYB26_008313 [Talaromyces marneffei]EEA21567.1 hypothetical protein PMAA_053710 [Talaromyces marneffei ATCC 18224]KAE8550944.1 hypothetical protein EYB25_007176 [Talaromyces marneffei]QGA20607.1 hypothetical protein EYB26_008313 [Talaromyces marneffei]